MSNEEQVKELQATIGQLYVKLEEANKQITKEKESSMYWYGKYDELEQKNKELQAELDAIKGTEVE